MKHHLAQALIQLRLSSEYIKEQEAVYLTRYYGLRIVRRGKKVR